MSLPRWTVWCGSVVLALGGCVDGAPNPLAVGSPCGAGERAVFAGGDVRCDPSAALSINLDERTDEGVEVRQGIGVNACIYAASLRPPLDERDGCALYVYGGQSANTPIAASTGGVAIYLDPPVLLSKASDSACFTADLDRERRALFTAWQSIVVEGLGGADLDPFIAKVKAPSALAISAPQSAAPGDDVVIRWETAVSEPGERIVIALRAADVDADIASHIVCTASDADGEVTISGALTAGLVDDESWQLFALRQNGAHREPPASDLVIDLFATTSVTRAIDVER